MTRDNFTLYIGVHFIGRCSRLAGFSREVCCTCITHIRFRLLLVTRVSLVHTWVSYLHILIFLPSSLPPRRLVARVMWWVIQVAYCWCSGACPCRKSIRRKQGWDFGSIAYCSQLYVSHVSQLREERRRFAYHVDRMSVWHTVCQLSHPKWHKCKYFAPV
jgi:hypothetical protein